MRKFAILLILAFLTVPLFAQRKVTIKIASPIPESTPWGRFLNEVANDWRKISNGEVDIIVYHNGVAGTEKDVVRSLRVNQIQAALLSTLGLYEISPEVMTLSCPFLIRDDDELDLVLSGLRADLEEKINS
jgi:TRAP-type C4-dicarboxylate transport system substrate-binding protein